MVEGAAIGTQNGYLGGNLFGHRGFHIRFTAWKQIGKQIRKRIGKQIGKQIRKRIGKQIGKQLGSKQFFINYDNKQLIKKEYKDIIQCCTSFVCTI